MELARVLQVDLRHELRALGRSACTTHLHVGDALVHILLRVAVATRRFGVGLDLVHVVHDLPRARRATHRAALVHHLRHATTVLLHVAVGLAASTHLVHGFFVLTHFFLCTFTHSVFHLNLLGRYDRYSSYFARGDESIGG